MKLFAQTLRVFAWILLAGVLFFAFGLMAGNGAGRTVVSAGWLPESGRPWVTDGVWAAGGLFMLGLSFVYRRLAAQDNSGSMAAWLAGWALLLYGVSSLLAMVSGVLVVGFLVATIAVWGFRTMISSGGAAAGLRGPAPDASECERDDARHDGSEDAIDDEARTNVGGPRR
jgi:hypothetical protein